MRSDVAETGIGQLDWTARKIDGHYRDAISPFVREFRFFLLLGEKERERGKEEEIKKFHTLVRNVCTM